MDKDFTFGGREFKLGELDPFKQLHIVKRVGPILGEILPVMKDAIGLKKIEHLSEAEKLEAVAKFITPIAHGFSKLGDEDLDKVLMLLLSSVEIKTAIGNWAKVANGTMLMFNDLKLPALLQVAGRAFMYNLADFFPALPQFSQVPGELKRKNL